MTALQRIQNKIHSASSLALQVNAWRREQKKIVFTNGCFDIFHLGHLDYLSKAADLGDVLIVGINSDLSVVALKGNHRPIIEEQSRKSLIAALDFVNAVILFDEATPLKLITAVLPDVLVKGSDYHPETIVGYDVVKQAGGTVSTIDLIPGYSTSLIEKKIIENKRN